MEPTRFVLLSVSGQVGEEACAKIAYHGVAVTRVHAMTMQLYEDPIWPAVHGYAHVSPSKKAPERRRVRPGNLAVLQLE
jgi:hypothetical protein